MMTAPMSIDTSLLPATLPMNEFATYMPQKVIEAIPQTWYGSVWSWITASGSHIFITLLLIALIINFIQNERRHEARIGNQTALMAVGVSVWSVCINYNMYLGIFFTICSVWALSLSTRYNTKVKDREETKSEVAIPAPSLSPQASVYSDAGQSVSLPTPRINVDLGFNLR